MPTITAPNQQHGLIASLLLAEVERIYEASTKEVTGQAVALVCYWPPAYKLSPHPIIMSLAKRNSDAAKAWAAKRRDSKERALLQQQARSSSSTTTPRRPSLLLSQDTKPPPKHSASTSHEANAEYMEDFREGMAKMYLALEGPSGGGGRDDELVVRRTQQQQQDRSYLSGASEGAVAGPTSANRSSKNLHPRGNKGVLDRSRRCESKGGGGGRSIETAPERILLANEREKESSGGAVAGWYRGPVDPAGHVSLSYSHNMVTVTLH